MVRYSLKERALIATKFEVLRSIKAVNRWWYQYNGKKNVTKLSYKTVSLWHTKLLSEGSLSEDKRCQKKKNKAEDERTTTLVRRIAKEMPGRSVRDLAIRTGVKKTTVHKILRKTLNFKPWKPIRCHELKDNDYQKCYDFGETMLELRRQDPRFFSNIVWSDEASFHINGCVTLRNCYFWAPKNQKFITKRQLENRGLLFGAE